MPPLRNGATLKNGKYTIVNMLGNGAFGITYLATTHTSLRGDLGDMAIDVNVTIKEFYMSTLNSRSDDGTTVKHTDSSLVKDYKRKFIREAENLSRLQHDNIVKVLEVFEENNTAYYVMEYLDGGTVDDLIKAKVRLSAVETVEITRQVCAALQYMHGNRMLHLDLKPKNIMLTSKGEVKLIDFGLSKQYDEKGMPEDSTSIGLGTQGYAPIEQANYRQDGSLPVTLDIYALGATMYKMLTGIVPPSSSVVLNNGLPIQPLQQARVPQQLVKVVLKAMAPILRNRYQSVEELDTLLSNMSTEELTIPIVEQTQNENTYFINDDSGAKDGRPQRQPADPSPHRPTINPQPAIAQPQSSKWWKTLAIVLSVVALGIVALLVVESTSEDEDIVITEETPGSKEVVDNPFKKQSKKVEKEPAKVETKDDYVDDSGKKGDDNKGTEENNSGYILDTHYLTDADLDGKTQEEITIIRNYMYAWHGYEFKTAWLAEYFKQFSWYHPYTNNAVTVANSFNAVEKANVDFIVNYEKRHK